MQTLMTSCHHVSTWHKWNTDPGDVVVMWFSSNENLVMLQWACVHAIIKMGASKYLIGLMGMPADSNFKKLTTSNCNVLITQKSNEDMPNMFPIVCLNENLRYFNDNLAWGK